MRPGHDIHILFVEHLSEQCDLVRTPLLVVSIKKAANQQVGFLGAAMMRSPMKAFEFRVGKHFGDVVWRARHCERRMKR